MTDKRGPTYVNQLAKIVYLANPKTASISTSKALLHGAGFMRVNQMAGYHHAQPSERLGSEWIVCTAVRNHFDAFVSWYFHMNRHDKGPFSTMFLDSLVGTTERPNHYFPHPHRMWHYQAQYATHLLHFESLEADLNAVLSLRDLGPVSLGEENVSVSRARRPYQEFHDLSTRLWIEKRYWEEMGELGYQWEPLLGL
jgi:hypothetical protein